jgi:hypothetical protein
MQIFLFRGTPMATNRSLQFALIVAAALSSTSTLAQDLRVGCSLVHQYSGAEVNVVMDQVRSTVGESEANGLHAKYVGLKNDCSSNQNAFRVIRLSPAMQKLLVQYGVNVGRLAASGR